jgi:hypothetical protein
MKRLVLIAAGLLTCTVLALGSAATTAHASHLLTRVSEPTTALVGQPSEVDAAVTSADTGAPVAGVSVTFYAHATFGRVDGFMEIGRAVTNSAGVAAISFVPRESGTHDIRVDYTGSAGSAVEQTTAAIAVDGAAPQMYVQKAGIQVPGLNSWLIMGLLTVVWGTLIFIGVTIIRIARAGRADGLALAVPAGRGSVR